MMASRRHHSARPLLAEGETVLRPNDYLQTIECCEDHRALYTAPESVAIVISEIIRIVRENDVCVLSFDVFDTAALRAKKSEARRFMDIAEQFAADQSRTGGAVFSPEDAFLARAMAARAAYSFAPVIDGGREGAFEDIARITCELLCRPDLTDHYIEAEISYEARAIKENPLVGAVRAALPDVEIIYISDMYLEGGKIARLLNTVFDESLRGRVFSSADGCGSKRAGGLFRHVSASLAVPGSRILHIGDNLHSDYRMPRIGGWHSFYLPLPKAEREARQRCFEMLEDDFARVGINLSRYLNFNM